MVLEAAIRAAKEVKEESNAQWKAQRWNIVILKVQAGYGNMMVIKEIR